MACAMTFLFGMWLLRGSTSGMRRTGGPEQSHNKQKPLKEAKKQSKEAKRRPKQSKEAKQRNNAKKQTKAKKQSK